MITCERMKELQDIVDVLAPFAMVIGGVIGFGGAWAVDRLVQRIRKTGGRP